MKKEDHFLHFTRKERTGIAVMLFLILATIAASGLYGRFHKQEFAVSDSALKKFMLLRAAIDTLSQHNNSYENESYAYVPGNVTGEKINEPELFHFDPNTLPVEGWQKLGVSSKTVVTIRKYISKGGKFYKPDDIRKIWGLERVADKLIPYVRIESSREYRIPPLPLKGGRSQHRIDINEADSLQWLSLPGIGPSFSKRIISFRKRLGGFYSVEQVAETFGLPDSVFNKIRPRLTLSSPSVKKININSATFEELKSHPYLRYQLANVIVQYRLQHGDFKSVEALNNIMIINDSILRKIRPYLDVL